MVKVLKKMGRLVAWTLPVVTPVAAIFGLDLEPLEETLMVACTGAGSLVSGLALLPKSFVMSLGDMAYRLGVKTSVQGKKHFGIRYEKIETFMQSGELWGSIAYLGRRFSDGLDEDDC